MSRKRTPLLLASNSTINNALTDSGGIFAGNGVLMVTGLFTCAGTTLQFGSGAVTDVFTPGSVLAADRVLFNGGSYDLQGSYSAQATATINGPAVTFDGTAAPQVGDLAVHTIGRSGDRVIFNSG